MNEPFSPTDDWSAAVRAYFEYQVRVGLRSIVLEPRPEMTSDFSSNAAHELNRIREELGECTRCRLHNSRSSIVFGEGNPEARIMFVGEGPGADEDEQGRPFVGAAGQLLTRMIDAMGLERSEVYITNIVKCRPPKNRDPKSDEQDTCFQFLVGQMDAVKPEVIIALGKVAASKLLDSDEPISRLRGDFRDCRGFPVMPTYHPSFLLRQGEDRRWKGQAWEDLKKVMGRLDLPLNPDGA